MEDEKQLNGRNAAGVEDALELGLQNLSLREEVVSLGWVGSPVAGASSGLVRNGSLHRSTRCLFQIHLGGFSAKNVFFNQQQEVFFFFLKFSGERQR